MESARIACDSWPKLRKDLLTALLASGLTVFGMVVLLLFARRIAGALVQPLGGLSLVGVAALGLFLAFVWRLGWQARSSQNSSWVPVLPGITLFVLLSVLSLPETANWALMLTWLAFLTGEAAWWWTAYSSLRQPQARRNVPPITRVSFERAAPEDTESTMPDDVFQSVTRSRAGNQERVSALLRVSFVRGQRTAVTHLAFCPPLCATPKLSAETTDGPEASVAITSSQPFGARLEIRLEGPESESCDVLVELQGHAPLAQG